MPKIFDLLADPKEENGATATPNGWAVEPSMKIVGDFEKSLKEHPPIAPDTPDPYVPRVGRAVRLALSLGAKP